MVVLRAPSRPILHPSAPLIWAKPKHGMFLRICSKDFPTLDHAFRQKGTSRFDDPKETYRTLYCAPDFETCYAETILRENAYNGLTGRYEVSKTIHNSRMLQLLVIDVMCLKLVDLLGSSSSMGLNGATGLSEYDHTRWLAHELYHHSQQPDGIWYQSKFATGPNPALVLFDRARLHVSLYPATKPQYLLKLKPLFNAMTNVRPVDLI